MEGTMSGKFLGVVAVVALSASIGAASAKDPVKLTDGNNFAGLSVELLDELKETTAPAIAGLAEDERADVDEIVGMLTGNLEKAMKKCRP
jgi:hypothetical protein